MNDLAIARCFARGLLAIVVLLAGSACAQTSAADFYARADAHAKKRDYASAIQEFTEAIRLDPHYQAAFSRRGFVYLDTGDLERALQDFKQALQLDPKDVRALDTRGRAYERKGDADHALQDFTAALAIDPNFDW